MKKYLHYNEEVIYQQLADTSFKDELKKNDIDYMELPILDSDVITYIKDGKRKYACIVVNNTAETYIENVYLTDQIPLDMSWENLVLDCKGQRNGEPLMEMETKAKVICKKAEEMVLAETKCEFYEIPEVSPEMFRLALISLGYTIDDICGMKHHDINEDFLNKMRGNNNEKKS